MRALIAVCLLVGVLTVIPNAAIADPPACPGGETPAEVPGGWVCIPVSTPGGPGDGATGGDGGGGGEVTPAGCFDGSQEVPCHDGFGGIWDPGRGCYAFQLSPQPLAESPLWHGHSPEEGAVWSCDHTVSLPTNTWFVANSQVALVDPAVLAQEALGRMRLERADAEIAPAPDFHTYVHVANWLWLSAGQWHELEQTVSAGPTSVTVVAQPTRVAWDMGTETHYCYDAGRPWVQGMTEAAQTTCSYAYDSLADPTGDIHQVSAELVYAVTWSCSGACLSPEGDLGEITSPAGAATSIEVRQRQTVVVS